MVNYRVVFAAKADHETLGLPADAFTTLFETLTEISRDYRAATFPDALSDPEFRWAPFGEHGLVSVYVNDWSRTIYVHDITWTG